MKWAVWFSNTTCSSSTIYPIIHPLDNVTTASNKKKKFSSYLSEGKQFVKIGDTESDTLFITKGVPQGSVLGLVLFLIYIDDLPGYSLLKALLFADDITLFASADKLEEFIF